MLIEYLTFQFVSTRIHNFSSYGILLDDRTFNVSVRIHYFSYFHLFRTRSSCFDVCLRQNCVFCGHQHGTTDGVEASWVKVGKIRNDYSILLPNWKQRCSPKVNASSFYQSFATIRSTLTQRKRCVQTKYFIIYKKQFLSSLFCLVRQEVSFHVVFVPITRFNGSDSKPKALFVTYNFRNHWKRLFSYLCFFFFAFTQFTIFAVRRPNKHHFWWNVRLIR